MEAKKGENVSSCGGKKPVRAYCQRCKVYICPDCHVTKHIDHDKEVTDLAEKCTRYLADFQKLSRAASLMADRRQVHIKDESVERIVDDIRSRITQAKEQLQGDINKSAEHCVSSLRHSPLVQEFIRRRLDLVDRPDDPLMKARAELTGVCRELLHDVSANKFESADKIVSDEKLQKYEEEIKQITKDSDKDLEFIHEIKKLKQTKVDYSYDPMAIMGMIKVNTQVKKPNRILQFDREKNALNIYVIDTQRAVRAVVDSGFIMPFRFITVEVCNNVYLSGGDNDHGQFLKSLHVYDELRGGLVPLSEMHLGRSRHAIVPLEEKRRFYVLGGETAEGVTGSCEVYDVRENAWESAPSLHQPRCGLSACLLASKFLYALCGWDQQYLGSIERLEVGEKEWETVKLSKKHNALVALQCAGAVATGEHEILVFGGYKEGEELSRETFVFDTRTMAVTKGGDIANEEAFVASEAKKVEGKCYCFGYTKGGVHVYNVDKDEWSFTPQDKLQFAAKDLRLTKFHTIIMD